MHEEEAFNKFEKELSETLEKAKITIKTLIESFRFYPDENCMIPFDKDLKPMDCLVYSIQRIQYELNETFLHSIQGFYYELDQADKKSKELTEKWLKGKENKPENEDTNDQ